MQVTILRTDGEIKHHEIVGNFLDGVRNLIGADTLDFVNLRDGRQMAVDDLGWEYVVEEIGRGHFKHRPTKARKPVNREATKLYHRVCRPGVTHEIVGDVAIFVDSDLA